MSAPIERSPRELRLAPADPAVTAELLRRRDEILTVVANAAEQLLRAPDWRDALQEVLERIGQAAAVDRVFLFESRRDALGNVSRMTAEWAREGVSPSIESPYWQAYRDDPGDVAELSAGRVVRVLTRLASEEEGRVMRSEGIVTSMSVPILVAGTLWGYLGLDDCKEERPWETVETDALRAAAGILGAAVERSRSRAELDASERILTAVARGAHQVVGAPSWHEAIDNLLAVLGEGTGASRAYLFECRVTPLGVLSTLTQEWVADGISSSLVDEFWTDSPEPEEDAARFLAGEPVQFLRHETDAETLAGMEAEGTLSVISVPIFVEGALAGYIGFDDCASERIWTPAELESLRIGAGLVGSAWLRARNEEVLLSRERILTAAAGSAERLLHARAVTDAIDPLLAELGRAAGASRAYVFRTVEGDDGDVVSSHAYEWVREGVSATIAEQGWQQVRLAPAHAAALLAGGAFQAVVDEFDGPSRPQLDTDGTLSFVDVPITVGGALWGLVGFEDCRTARVWDESELDALRIVAGLIGSALERELSDARVDARERILEAVTAAAERLLRAPSWRDGVEEVLGLLGRAGVASRCWLFECEETVGGVRSRLTREWVAPGISRSRVEEFWSDRTEPPRAVEAFLRGEPIQLLRDEMPPDHAEKLAAEGTLSVICVPILIDGRLAGYVGYDDCVTARRWSPAEQDALRAAAGVLGSAMQHARNLAAIRAREAILAAVAAASERALAAATLEEGIVTVIAEIGAATGASRMVVAELAEHDGSVATVRRHGWAAPGVEPAASSIVPDELPVERLVAYERGDVLSGLTTDLTGPTRERLESTGTLSFLTIPVLVGGRVWGVLGLDDCVTARRFETAETEAIRVTAGVIAGMVERERSVEALRESDERLWHAQKMEAIGRLASGLAHDLRNYLTVIVNYATFVREQLGEDARADIDVLLETTERVGDLVDRLVSFGRPSETIAPEVLDVGDVVRGVREVVASVLDDTHELRVEVADGLDPVHIDRDQLERVIVNLAMNARDAMPGGGTLAIEVRPDVGGVAIEVSDTGLGMDEATRARVLEPFFTTKAGAGTGLGLAIVYGIVSASGGRLEVASAPDLGTRVTVLLPRAA